VKPGRRRAALAPHQLASKNCRIQRR
jgi:hypothetical protein